MPGWPRVPPLQILSTFHYASAMPIVAVIPEPNKPAELREVRRQTWNSTQRSWKLNSRSAELTFTCNEDSCRVCPIHSSRVTFRLDDYKRFVANSWMSTDDNSKRATALLFLMCTRPAMRAGTVLLPKRAHAVHIGRFTGLPMDSTMDYAVGGPAMSI